MTVPAADPPAMMVVTSWVPLSGEMVSVLFPTLTVFRGTHAVPIAMPGGPGVNTPLRVMTVVSGPFSDLTASVFPMFSVTTYASTAKHPVHIVPFSVVHTRKIFMVQRWLVTSLVSPSLVWSQVQSVGGKSSFPTLQVTATHSGGVWGTVASVGTDAVVVRPPLRTVSREFVYNSPRTAKIGAKFTPTVMSTATYTTTDGIGIVVVWQERFLCSSVIFFGPGWDTSRVDT